MRPAVPLLLAATLALSACGAQVSEPAGAATTTVARCGEQDFNAPGRVPRERECEAAIGSANARTIGQYDGDGRWMW